MIVMPRAVATAMMALGLTMGMTACEWPWAPTESAKETVNASPTSSRPTSAGDADIRRSDLSDSGLSGSLHRFESETLASKNELSGAEEVALLSKQAHIFPRDASLRLRLAGALARAGRFDEALTMQREIRRESWRETRRDARADSGTFDGNRIDHPRSTATSKTPSDLQLLHELRAEKTRSSEALADHLLQVMAPADRSSLGDDDILFALERARARGGSTEIRDWAELLARRRPNDAGVARAWWEAMRDAGRPSIPALKVAWRLMPGDSALFRALMESGDSSVREMALREYTGPRDAAVLGLLRDLRHAGSLDVAGLKEIARASTDSHERALMELVIRVRGSSGAPTPMKATWRDPRARVLLGDDVERATAYLEWGLPRRAARSLMTRRVTDSRVAVVLVRALAAAGEDAAAAAWLPAALSREPRAMDLLQLAYRAAVGRQDHNGMVSSLERLLAVDSTSVLAHRDLPGLYVKDALTRFDDRPRALAILNRVLTLDHSSAVAHYNLALLYSMTGETAKAVDHVEAALAASPQDAVAQLLAASLYKKSGDRGKAVVAYRAAIGAGAAAGAAGAAVEARKELALLLWQQGETATALVAATEAWKMDPDDARMARTCGVLGVVSGHPRDAIKPLSLARRAYPGDLEVKAAYAESLLANGRPAAARETILGHPDRVLVAVVGARAHLAEHHAGTAYHLVKPYRDALRARDAYGAALAQFADEKLATGDLPGAIALWREWQAWDPRAQVPRTLLAAAQPSAQPAAQPAAQSAARPSSAPPARSITPTPPTTTSPTTTATRVVVPAANPADVQRGISAAAQALSKGQVVRAEQRARAVISMAPGNFTAWNLLALSLSRQSKNAEAMAAFNRSLKIRPAQDEVRAAMEELRRP